METSQSTPQPPEADVDAGAEVEATPEGISAPVSDGTSAPPPAPEAPDGGEDEPPGEENAASEDPAPDPRIAELEAERERLMADLESANAMVLLGDERLAEIAALEARVAEYQEAAAKASQDAQEAAERHAEVFNAWADVVIKDAILGALKGRTFLGGHPETQALYCRDFLKLMGGTEAFAAERHPGGSWIVKARDGSDLRTFIELKSLEFSHFFESSSQGGSGFRGGFAPPAQAHPVGSIEAIASSYNQRRALNKPRY